MNMPSLVDIRIKIRYITNWGMLSINALRQPHRIETMADSSESKLIKLRYLTQVFIQQQERLGEQTSIPALDSPHSKPANLMAQ